MDEMQKKITPASLNFNKLFFMLYVDFEENKTLHKFKLKMAVNQDDFK